jgi:hypothetical protein
VTNRLGRPAGMALMVATLCGVALSMSRATSEPVSRACSLHFRRIRNPAHRVAPVGPCRHAL